MDNYNITIAQLKEEFKTHNGRFLRTNKTNNLETRLKYTLEFIASYNKFVEAANNLFEKLGYEEKTIVREHFVYFKSQALQYIGNSVYLNIIVHISSDHN